VTRTYACLVSIGLLVAVLVPVRENFRADPRDGFPLSYYPMFTHAHPALQEHTYVVGFDRWGERVRIHYRHAGTGGLNQVRKQLSRVARRGGSRARRLCQDVVRRLARREPALYARLVRVDLRTGLFDPAAYFAAGDRLPRWERVHAGVVIRPAGVSLEGFPAWLAKHLGSREWADPPRDRTLTRGILEESLRRGRDFLLANQLPAGNFNYQYDFVTRTLDSSDSQVRQAGALWGVSLLHHHAPEPATRRALDRGIGFLLAHTVPGPAAGALLFAYPGERESLTGTTALGCLALVEYLRSARSPAVRIEAAYQGRLEETLAGYLRHLEWMQRDDGRFSAGYVLETGTRSRKASPYFDGESMLCLVKAAKYLEHDDLVPRIERSALPLAKYYTADQWTAAPDSDLTKGFFQWSAMAFWEYQDAGWEHAEALGDYVLSLGWWMLHTHHTLERRRNTAYAYEGIVPAYRIALARGDERAAADLAFTIDRGLRTLTSWQVGGPLAAENPYLAAHPTDDPLAVGGVMNAASEPPLRIDVAQHQMHAVILALQHVYAAESAP
jgi:UDP-N-acetylmuramoyl-tripeptide--D-alanyl-D-alanine ligase